MVFAALEELLVEDDSPYALCPGDRAALHEMVMDSGETVLAGIPRGTLSADNNGVAYAARFCLRKRTPFVRPMVLDGQADVVRESFMYARFVTEVAREMAPRSRKRRAEDGTVITDAKPSSALGPLYGWRRVLRDGGAQLPPLTMIKSHIKGLVAGFKAKWGVRAMVPERRVPFSKPQLDRIAAVLREREVADWSEVQHQAVALAFKFGLSTGARADELTHPSDHYKRSAFQIVLADGTELPMTPFNLAWVPDGTLIRVRAGPSKCDREDTEWGDRDMWFRVDRSNPLNFAAAWLEWELAHPCALEDRGKWAAFSPDGGPRPFTTRALQRDFMQAVTVAIGAEEAARRSFHALRVTAATALNTRKRPDGAIQCVLRWKTLEAMRLYAKMNRTHYADLVDEITTTEIEVTRAASNPALEPSDTIEALDEVMADLDLDEFEVAGELLDGKPAPARAARRGARRSDGEGSAGRQLAETAAVGAAELAAAAAPGRMARRRAAAADVTGAPAVRSVEVVGAGDALLAVDVLLADAWGLTGRPFAVHNNLWPQQPGDDWDPMGTTACTVVGQCAAPFDFGGGRCAPAYVIACDGVCYSIRESALRTYFPKGCRAKRKASARA